MTIIKTTDFTTRDSQTLPSMTTYTKNRPLKLYINKLREGKRYK